MRALIGGLIVLAIIIAIGIVFLVSYVRSNSKSNQRERAFKAAAVAIESRKAKAIATKDLFEEWQADREAEALRQRYTNGEGPE